MAACNNYSRVPLQVLPVQKWRSLQTLYKQNWPKHILSYYTLKNYIEWAEKNPGMSDVRISTTDNDWCTHGTYILEDRNKLRYNVHINSLRPYHPQLLTVLKSLEVDPAYTLTGYVEQVRPVVESHLRDLGISDFSQGCCPTIVFYLPKEDCLNLTYKLSTEPFEFRALSEEHVEEIDNLWPHQYPGSDYKIRRIIRYNLTLGAFHQQTQELCAWVMVMQIGTIGLLQVKDAYKRRGLGEQLVRLLCRQMAAAGMDATATVMPQNTASRNLFEKLGFRAIDRAYWFDKAAVTEDKTDANAISEMASLKHG